MDHLAVRFHVRGKLEYDGKEWNYIGGRIGHSTVEVLDLSIEVLKLHLLEFLVISDEDLEDTTLSWRLIDNERNSRCMCRLDDDSNVKNMVKHVTRVAAGFVEIFAVSPERHGFASSDEEEEAMVIEEKEEQQCQHEQQVVTEHQVQDEEQVLTQQQLEIMQIKMEHEHQVEYEQQEGRQIEHLDEQFLQAFVPNIARKMPVVRAPLQVQDKGKEIEIDSANGGDDAEDRSDSDYDDLLEADSGDSSADDDEALFYRKYAEELKQSVRRQMLGEDRAKVKEDFIIPENIKEAEEEGSDCFDSDDNLSFDEDSDGEVKTSRTKHRVYDQTAEVKEFEVGQCFTDSREFKQALVNYGLKEHHHLRFTKDERTRVLAKCSWVSCPWSIYGSLVPSRSQWFTVRRWRIRRGGARIFAGGGWRKNGEEVNAACGVRAGRGGWSAVRLDQVRSGSSRWRKTCQRGAKPPAKPAIISQGGNLSGFV